MTDLADQDVTADYLTEAEQHQVNEYVADFVRSGKFGQIMREQNFSLGMPVIYMDDQNENVLVTEYPDGQITKELVSD